MFISQCSNHLNQKISNITTHRAGHLRIQPHISLPQSLNPVSKANMRAPAKGSASDARATDNSISISSTASLHITLAVSPLPTPRHHRHKPRHTPIILPSGVISTSPPYRTSTSGQPVFVPHRPTFSQPRLSEDTRKIEDARTEEGTRTEGKEKRIHAALIAHLKAELREDSGPWVDMMNECTVGRDGYQGKS